MIALWALLSACILGMVIILLPDDLDPRTQAAMLVVVIGVFVLFLVLLDVVP